MCSHMTDTGASHLGEEVLDRGVGSTWRCWDFFLRDRIKIRTVVYQQNSEHIALAIREEADSMQIKDAIAVVARKVLD